MFNAHINTHQCLRMEKHRNVHIRPTLETLLSNNYVFSSRQIFERLLNRADCLHSSNRAIDFSLLNLCLFTLKSKTSQTYETLVTLFKHSHYISYHSMMYRCFSVVCTDSLNTFGLVPFGDCPLCSLLQSQVSW